MPTGRMIVEPGVGFPALEDARAAINGQTRAADNVFLDAQRLSDRLEYEVARLHLDAAENAEAPGRAWRGRTGPLPPASRRAYRRL